MHRRGNAPLPRLPAPRHRYALRKTGTVDENEEKQVIHKVSADSFKNAKDEVIKLMYTITFDKVSSEKLIEAYAMNLTAECYVVNGAGTTVYAKGSGISQDMRSVASFNVLNGEENPALEDYYGDLDVVSNQAKVASYVSGTKGVKIAVDGLKGTDYDVYIDTYYVENAKIEDGAVIILEDDMPAFSGAEKHFIQLFDVNGNVIAKELTEVVDTYAETVTLSALDGDIDYSKIFGNETVAGVEVLSSTAEQTSTVTFADGKLNGIDTIRTTWTDVQVKLTAEYSVKKVNLKVATKIIEDADDMAVFTISTTNELFVQDGSLYKMDGYYVLANDVTLTSALMHNNIALDNANFQSNTYGFKGVLDGQGYTVTAPINQTGLFGALGAGVVIKNVHFNLTASLGSSNHRASGLFSQFSGSINYGDGRLIFENLWIKVSGQSANFSPIISRNSNTYDYKNVVIDLSDLDCTTGYIWGTSQMHSFTNAHVDKLSGINVISKQPFLLWSGINVVPANMYDAFDGIEYEPGKTTIESGKTYKYKANGVNQYSDVKELIDANVTLPAVDNGDGVVMTTTKNKVDLVESATISLKKDGQDIPFTLSASNENLTVSGNTVMCAGNGGAVITASYEIDGKAHSKTIFMTSIVNVINYNTQDTPYIFSADDGDMPAGMLANDETIIKAVANGQTLTVEKNQIKGFKLSTDGYGRDVATNGLIDVYTSKSNIYKVYVTAYTKTIDSAEDMLYFNLSEEKTLTGIYKMTANVEVDQTTASQITHGAVTAIASTAYGFKGVFDGDGYTLSGYIPTKGYFGAMVYYGVIKNLAIDAVPYVISGVENVVFAYAGGAGGNGTMPLTVTDVSVKVSGTVTTFAGLFGRSFGFLTSNSLFVDLSELTANTGYVITYNTTLRRFNGTNIFAISTLGVARLDHWTGGKFAPSNLAIPEGVTTTAHEGFYYFTIDNVKYWTFDGTADHSATNAKCILYADYAELFANQKTADSYTGYGSTGAQFTNATYWKMTEKTVTTESGDVTGVYPVWVTKN